MGGGALREGYQVAGIQQAGERSSYGTEGLDHIHTSGSKDPIHFRQKCDF